jgi:hypothetical protein
MRKWKGRWHASTSFLICGIVVVLGTLLYPLILLFFTTIALVHPICRKLVPGKTGDDPPARENEVGK